MKYIKRFLNKDFTLIEKSLWRRAVQAGTYFLVIVARGSMTEKFNSSRICTIATIFNEIKFWTVRKKVVQPILHWLELSRNKFPTYPLDF